MRRVELIARIRLVGEHRQNDERDKEELERREELRTVQAFHPCFERRFLGESIALSTPTAIAAQMSTRRASAPATNVRIAENSVVDPNRSARIFAL